VSLFRNLNTEVTPGTCQILMARPEGLFALRAHPFGAALWAFSADAALCSRLRRSSSPVAMPSTSDVIGRLNHETTDSSQNGGDRNSFFTDKLEKFTEPFRW